MDDKIMAVLDAYHERMKQEGEGRPSGAPDDWYDRHLLAVGPETGQLVNIIARNLKSPNILEIGTSYGYSAIWLGDAVRVNGGRLTTLELKDYKSAYAHDMANKAGLADYIEFKIGDALELIEELAFGIDFVLLDLWDHLYVPCLKAFYPKLNPGAIIVADNVLYPSGDDARAYSREVRALPGMTSVLLPVGAGIEVSRLEVE